MHLLLCTDLDRTLLPNGDAIESPLARERFMKLVKHPDIILAFVTGRHDELVKEAIVQFDLPEPDYVIADVGSTIYSVNESNWKTLESWRSLQKNCWHGVQGTDIHNCLSDFDFLKLQEPQKQAEFKLSYYAAIDLNEKYLISEINQCLKEKHIQANIIWSIDEVNETGLLDILPVTASKLQAIGFLGKQLSISENATLFAGDSGNDYSVLISSIPSVLVANAGSELKQRVTAEVTTKGLKDRHYIAQGHFMGMNGNYSAGILEGIVHYYPFTQEWIKV